MRSLSRYSRCPCALGFNVWSGAELPGIGNIQAIEDFVVSNNLLIVGSLVFTLFCVEPSAAGMEKFFAGSEHG